MQPMALHYIKVHACRIGHVWITSFLSHDKNTSVVFGICQSQHAIATNFCEIGLRQVVVVVGEPLQEPSEAPLTEDGSIALTWEGRKET